MNCCNAAKSLNGAPNKRLFSKKVLNMRIFRTGKMRPTREPRSKVCWMNEYRRLWRHQKQQWRRTRKQFKVHYALVAVSCNSRLAHKNSVLWRSTLRLARTSLASQMQIRINFRVGRGREGKMHMRVDSIRSLTSIGFTLTEDNTSKMQLVEILSLQIKKLEFRFLSVSSFTN